MNPNLARTAYHSITNLRTDLTYLQDVHSDANRYTNPRVFDPSRHAHDFQTAAEAGPLRVRRGAAPLPGHTRRRPDAVPGDRAHALGLRRRAESRRGDGETHPAGPAEAGPRRHRPPGAVPGKDHADKTR